MADEVQDLPGVDTTILGKGGLTLTGNAYEQQNQILEVLRVARESGASPQEALRSALRQVAVGTVPARQAAISEGILQSQRLASGSPQEVFASYNDQINQLQAQLREAMRVTNRQGGYSLGGQRDIAQGRTLGAGATQLQGLFSQAALQGNRNLLTLASSIRPLTATSIPGAQESVRQQPFNAAGLGQGLGSLVGNLQRLFPEGGSALSAQQASIAPYPGSVGASPPLLSGAAGVTPAAGAYSSFVDIPPTAFPTFTPGGAY